MIGRTWIVFAAFATTDCLKQTRRTGHPETGTRSWGCSPRSAWRPRPGAAADSWPRSPGHGFFKFETFLSDTLPDVPLSPTPLPEVCIAQDLRMRPRECRREPFRPRLCMLENKSCLQNRLHVEGFYLSPTVNRAEVTRRRCIMLLWPGPGCWHLWHLRGQ